MANMKEIVVYDETVDVRKSFWVLDIDRQYGEEKKSAIGQDETLLLL